MIEQGSKALPEEEDRNVVLRIYNERLEGNPIELLRLRGEVGLLQKDNQALAQAKAKGGEIEAPHLGRPSARSVNT